MRRRVEEDPLGAALDALLETPQAQDILNRVRDVIDRAGAAVDPQARQQRQQRRQQQRQPDPLQTARRVLHFAPDEPLTREKITRRRREMARKCHPDHGGDTEMMQAINKAAEALIESV